MKVEHKQAAGTVRISTGKFTSPEEVDRAIQIISEAIQKLV
jgi:cysteine sulfinate desulfinase/cysteine desulfurase-like protein